MKALRTVHAVAGILTGLALAAMIYGPLRLAVAILAAVILLQIWSLEMLRAAIRRQENDR